GQRHGRLFRCVEDGFQRSLGAYERSLAWVLDHRRAALAFSVCILVGTAALFMIVPKGFIPSEDIDQITGTTETAEGTSFDAMVRRQQQVAAIVVKDPNIEGFMSSLGGGGSTGANQGRLFIRLKPRAQRR